MMEVSLMCQSNLLHLSYQSLYELCERDAGVSDATANPDISGIGIRASFYLQNFLLGK